MGSPFGATVLPISLSAGIVGHNGGEGVMARLERDRLLCSTAARAVDALRANDALV
ncbi:MAG TPA: hypothetical protein VIJ55_07240 [Acetobacteraceae bacterium]